MMIEKDYESRDVEWQEERGRRMDQGKRAYKCSPFVSISKRKHHTVYVA